MRSFQFPGMSNYRALVTAHGEQRSRDSSIESFRRGDDEKASSWYLIVLTCSTGGYVAHDGCTDTLHEADAAFLGCKLYGL